MPRDHARIKTSIWNDKDWGRLPHLAQWLYEAVLSQPLLSYCGVVTYTPDAFADLSAGVTTGQIRKAAKVLEDRDYIVIDPRTAELWCRTFVRHDGLLKQPNLIVAAVTAYDTIRSKRIRDAVVTELQHTIDNDAVEQKARAGARKMLDTLTKGTPLPFAEPLPEPPPQGSAEPPAEGSGEGSRVASRATPSPTPAPTTNGAVPNGSPDRARTPAFTQPTYSDEAYREPF